MVLIEEIKVWAASTPLPPTDGFDEHPLWTLSAAAGITTTEEGSLPRKEDQALLDKACWSSGFPAWNPLNEE